MSVHVYQLWSGIGLSTALLVWWRKHNCHHHRCPLLTWHESVEHGGHAVCRLHHHHHHGPLSRLFKRLGLEHGGSHPGARVKRRASASGQVMGIEAVVHALDPHGRNVHLRAWAQGEYDRMHHHDPFLPDV